MSRFIGKVERLFGFESSDLFPEGAGCLVGCQVLFFAFLLIGIGMGIARLIYG